mmetsp:Transcript_14726/g.19581  ORF Transcript_14726/g.19581 Transcript_14726/m.19581 type:complete len:86 (+) Transcript_14726:54-311(+)
MVYSLRLGYAPIICFFAFFRFVFSLSFYKVVAGMNYKLTLGMIQGENCLGVFKVTVYDRFGDMSVTNWGDEVSCEEIRDAEINRI